MGRRRFRKDSIKDSIKTNITKTNITTSINTGVGIGNRKQYRKLSKKKKTNQNSNTLRALLISAIIVVLISFLTTVVYAKYYILGVRQIPYIVRIGDKLGLAADRNVLDFGILPPGSTSFRSVMITPKQDMIIKIKSEGKAADWLSYEIKNYEGYKTAFLQANQTATITFYVNPDKTAKQGVYKGIIKIYMFRCFLC